jgi:uncharacterized protein (DUF2062 family)
MFKRAKPQTFRQKLRNIFWPCMGWRRLARYYRHRMGRLPGSAYYIAAGFACGVAVSVTPLIGLHILMGVLACALLRASVVAMVIGTLIAGNPWTFPLIWMGTYKTGHWLMGHGAAAGGKLDATPAKDLSWELLLESPMEFLVPMSIGALPYILPLWLAAFYGVRRLVTGYREARAEYLRQAYLRRISS